ncbi:unnamed protein product [Aphanomyces euteiches]
MTNVKVFSQQGHQGRNESLREFGDRIVEAAAETDMTDRTAVHFFLGGAYDQTQIAWLKSASRPPRTVDKCISVLRRRDVDVESTPDEVSLTRSRSDQPASPKPFELPPGRRRPLERILVLGRILWLTWQWNTGATPNKWKPDCYKASLASSPAW